MMREGTPPVPTPDNQADMAARSIDAPPALTHVERVHQQVESEVDRALREAEPDLAALHRTGATPLKPEERRKVARSLVIAKKTGKLSLRRRASY